MQIKQDKMELESGLVAGRMDGWWMGLDKCQTVGEESINRIYMAASISFRPYAAH